MIKQELTPTPTWEGNELPRDRASTGTEDGTLPRAEIEPQVARARDLLSALRLLRAERCAARLRTTIAQLGAPTICSGPDAPEPCPFLAKAEQYAIQAKSPTAWAAFMAEHGDALISEIASRVLPNLAQTIFYARGYDQRIGQWSNHREQLVAEVIHTVGLGVYRFDPRRGVAIRDYIRRGVETTLRREVHATTWMPKRERARLNHINATRKKLAATYSPEAVASGRLDPLIAEQVGLTGTLQEHFTELQRLRPRPLFVPDLSQPEQLVVRGDVTTQTPSVSELLERGEELECVRVALQRSPFSERNVRVFWLHSVEGWELESVAAQFGITRERVRQISVKVQSYLQRHAGQITNNERVLSNRPVDDFSRRAVGILPQSGEDLLRALGEYRSEQDLHSGTRSKSRTELYRRIRAVLGDGWLGVTYGAVRPLPTSAGGDGSRRVTVQGGRVPPAQRSATPQPISALIYKELVPAQFSLDGANGPAATAALHMLEQKLPPNCGLLIEFGVRDGTIHEVREMLEHLSRLALRLRRPFRIFASDERLGRQSLAAVAIGWRPEVTKEPEEVVDASA